MGRGEGRQREGRRYGGRCTSPRNPPPHSLREKVGCSRKLLHAIAQHASGLLHQWAAQRRGGTQVDSGSNPWLGWGRRGSSVLAAKQRTKRCQHCGKASARCKACWPLQARGEMGFVYTRQRTSRGCREAHATFACSARGSGSGSGQRLGSVQHRKGDVASLLPQPYISARAQTDTGSERWGGCRMGTPPPYAI